MNVNLRLPKLELRIERNMIHVIHVYLPMLQTIPVSSVAIVCIPCNSHLLLSLIKPLPAAKHAWCTAQGNMLMALVTCLL